MTGLRGPLAALRVPLLMLGLSAALAGLGWLLWGRPPGDLEARGREVFWGRGRCGSCHPLGGRGGGVRCPDLGPGTEGSLLDRAARRAPGQAPLDYLLESLYRPEAYTVPGYPAGLMPAVTLPPLALDDEDVRALIAFLTRGEAWEGELRSAQARFRGGLVVASRGAGDANAGHAVFDRMRCATCHVVEGLTAPEEAASARGRGPDLTDIGAIQGRAYLEESVWSPDAVVVPGEGRRFVALDGRSSRMPSYREVMTREELRDLVAFLETLR